MNVAILILGVLGLAFSVYAIRRPHWPNAVALVLVVEAVKLTWCPHNSYYWAIERTREGWLLVRCGSCASKRRRGGARTVRPS